MDRTFLRRPQARFLKNRSCKVTPAAFDAARILSSPSLRVNRSGSYESLGGHRNAGAALATMR